MFEILHSKFVHTFNFTDPLFEFNQYLSTLVYIRYKFPSRLSHNLIIGTANDTMTFILRQRTKLGRPMLPQLQHQR